MNNYYIPCLGQRVQNPHPVQWHIPVYGIGLISDNSLFRGGGTPPPRKCSYGNLLLRGTYTGKNNGFPFFDILGYLKNTHKNPKFGKVRQVPTKFPDWDLSHSFKFGIFVGIL